jgi:nucleotide-binding universal stress UspA family protein
MEHGLTQELAMYKKIMAAIADDEISWNALQEAIHMAGADDVKLCIVHAAATGTDDQETQHAREAGADLLQRARAAAAPKLEIETRLVEAEGEYGLNGISEAVANAVTEWGADLLIVGTKSRRGLERLVIGSVAEQLVSAVPVSILLARPR